MDISAIICTRNRAAQLAETLASLTKLRLPKGLEWELIIVDNGSTDHTSSVVNSFKEKLPVKRVMQFQAGLSNARNMGVEVSTGKYILFTDDDVLVDHNWIAAFACAFTRWPDAVIFGGKATPLLQPPTPSWFTNAACHLSDLLAIRDFGKEAIPLSREKKIMPYGLNYALRAAEQKRFLYNPDLGVAPGRRMGGEESDVFVRLMKAGYTGWWVPDAKVKHVIPPARQTTEYVRHFYEAIGELEVYGKLRNKRPFLLFGVPPLLWIKLPVTYARLHLGRCLGLSHHVPFLTSHAYRAGLFKAWRSAPCPTNKS